jgi:hypothetical protein
MKLTSKELKRQSTDGYVIISRPDKVQGGYTVMAVRVADSTLVGWDRHVQDKIDIAEAASSIQHPASSVILTSFLV